MPNINELLDLAARLRAFALQTALDDYAAQMRGAATELETQAAKLRVKQPASRRARVA